jgi:hypothetical protein
MTKNTAPRMTPDSMNAAGSPRMPAPMKEMKIFASVL